MLANAIPKVAIGIAGIVGAIGIGMAGYGVYWGSKKIYGWADEAAEEMQQWLDKAESVVVEGVVGKSKYTDPQTQQVYKNPFAGVPLVGGLFGYGMKKGAETDIERAKETPEEIIAKQEYVAEFYDINYVWSDKASRWVNGIKQWGAWINPSTGEVVSWDRSIDPNRGSDI